MNVFDNKTNSVIKKSKNDIYDIILFNHVEKLKEINKQVNSKEFNNILQKLVSFIFLDKGKKEFRNQLNMLSYNKRNIIVKTWEKLVSDSNINEDEFTNQLTQTVQKIAMESDDLDDEVDDESEADSFLPIPNNKSKYLRNILYRSCIGKAYNTRELA